MPSWRRPNRCWSIWKFKKYMRTIYSSRVLKHAVTPILVITFFSLWQLRLNTSEYTKHIELKVHSFAIYVGLWSFHSTRIGWCDLGMTKNPNIHRHCLLFRKQRSNSTSIAWWSGTTVNKSRQFVFLKGQIKLARSWALLLACRP